MTEPNFKLDKKALLESFDYPFQLCWVCKNRINCPMDWECETYANMDNDNTNIGDDEA